MIAVVSLCKKVAFFFSRTVVGISPHCGAFMINHAINGVYFFGGEYGYKGIQQGNKF